MLSTISLRWWGSPSKCTFYRFCLLILGVALVEGTSSNSTSDKVQSEKVLLDHLLKGYDSDVRPVLDNADVVTVTMHFNLKRIVKMDMKSQVLTTYAWLSLDWNDQLLQWDPSEFGNLTDIRIPLKSIWTPDLELYNGASEDVSLSYGYTPTVVKHTGNVSWIEPKTMSSMCPVDATYFPFDQQTCRVKIGSWTQHGFQMNLEKQIEEVEVDDFANLGPWTIVRTEMVKSTAYYSCCSSPYVDITAVIVMQRKSLHIVCTIILPWVLLSVITILSLSLPLENVIRIAIQIFIMSAFSVFMSWDITSALPESPDSTPLLLVYMILMMILSGLSGMATIAILKIFNIGNEINPRPLPQYLRWTLFREAPFRGTSGAPRTLNVNGITVASCPDATTARDDIPLTQYSTLDPFEPLEAPSSSISSGQHVYNSLERQIGDTSGRQSSGAVSGDQWMFQNQRFQHETNVAAEEWKMLARKLDTLCFRVFGATIALVNLSLIILAL